MNHVKYVLKKPSPDPKKKKKTRKNYYLYWREEDAYLEIKSSVYSRRNWNGNIFCYPLTFVKGGTAGMTQIDRATMIWREYEFLRFENNLPKLELVEAVHETMISNVKTLKSEVSDVDIIYKQIGKTVAEALAALPAGFKPVTAVKRKGKTSGVCRNLSDNVAEKGVYTFFENDDDATLAKISLAGNFVREYDIAGTIERFRNAISAQD